MRQAGIVLTISVVLGLIAHHIRASEAERHYVNSELPWHDAALDPQGKLLAWYHPEQNLGYDKSCILHGTTWTQSPDRCQRPV